MAGRQTTGDVNGKTIQTEMLNNSCKSPAGIVLGKGKTNHKGNRIQKKNFKTFKVRRSGNKLKGKNFS